MKKDGNVKMVNIREQTVEDLATGLTLRLEASEDGEARVCLSGSILPFGNREFQFDHEGQYA